MVAAFNLMIYFGPDTGYETIIGDLFAHGFLAGLLVVVAFVGGPFLGVVLMRRWRHSRHGNRARSTAAPQTRKLATLLLVSAI